MALANSSTAFTLRTTSILPAAPSFPYRTPTSFGTPTKCLPFELQATRKRKILFSQSFAVKNELSEADDGTDAKVEELRGPTETLLYSFIPLPLLVVAALPGAGTVRSLFGPFVELVKSWSLPDWLVHWGHPGNMAVVLFAMGGYGTYLGFRIRYSDDMEEKANAKDLHPKLLGGMFFFFALGATGGITSLLTSDKPIFESPHAVTGFIGLTLLTIQTILPTLFEGNPGLRNVHGILGSGIMTLFLIHAALGLQLGLSY
ncbi:uncharacterized protein LOC111311026 [Durio zibethinus]|uniref:Uncharacterized protein LOC111311026 n=1 Tax=Durio zibethinus TaxID=66656 RepID=A0A6P6AMV5_DURZI|nr:uncharacterized protein LOC111311026 [Durio zibethinus]